MTAETTEPLLALLEVMLRTFSVPKIKPGGHSEDIFVNLTDADRENYECSICYQILKDVRQCENKHKFCYSCIFVWSTSGSPTNHGRCPVCRVDGFYTRNKEVDDTINWKYVRCPLKTCNWTGPLKHLGSHQHTTYGDAKHTDTLGRNELPALSTDISQTPSASPATLAHAPLSARSTSNTQSADRRNGVQGNDTNNNSQTQQSLQRQTPVSSVSRPRVRSRSRQNTSSPLRRSNITATGLNRLTSRARIQNGNSIAPPTAREAASPRTPHPPPGPRPARQTRRRLPTLPSIVNPNNNNNSGTSVQPSTTDNNNNVSSVTSSVVSGETTPTSPITERPQRYIQEAAEAANRPPQQGFSRIRVRLNESRHRLDNLMSAFSVELDRGRNNLTEFQEERERRRQQQLEEVRDLGRRLGHVAQELRGLLTQRREIRDQIDHLADTVNDDSD